jgi:hypothetical protein
MHLQRQGDEHSVAQKALMTQPLGSRARHRPWGNATACHDCLKGPGSFVFVTIRRFSFAVRS